MDTVNEPTFVDRLMNNGDAPVAPVEGVIGKEQCMKWAEILRKYKSGKALLETRMRSNQEYWRGHQWREMRRDGEFEQPQPKSAWLTNTILAKHAARMDAYPEATILARELSDEPEAKLLTQIIPCILDMCEFKRTYSQVGWDKDISCAGAYCITWDVTKHNGLGDIDIAPLDLMNMYWEPGITDIQQSRYVFVVKLVDTDILQEQYPDKPLDKKGNKVIEPSKYVYEDNVDTSDKDCVIDVYYKKSVEGKTVLHYAKFVRDIVLFATENDPKLSMTGLYDHGLYPFVIEPVYPVKGSICGFGYVDICRDPQDFIDIIGNSIVKNVLENTTPRYFVRSDAKLNISQFNNINERIVECSGNLAEDSIRPFDQTALPSGALNFYQAKIDEMKQTAGNRDVSSGGTEHGVTAASALAVMQEAGNALARDENQVAYEAFKDIVSFVVELIRQFYDLPRFFRIGGERGAYQYITYTNARMKEQMEIGIDGTQFFRKPEFDLDISAAKQGEYTRQSQNQLALEFYQVGFFNPENAPATLACLDMMEFKGKEKVAANVQQMFMLAQAMMAAQPQEQTEDGGDARNGGHIVGEKTQQEKSANAAHNRAEKTQAKARASIEEGAKP